MSEPHLGNNGDSPEYHFILNKTASRIEIAVIPGTQNKDPFVIPPFGNRKVILSDFEKQFDYKGLEQRNLIAVNQDDFVKASENFGDIAVGLLVWVFIIAIIVGVLVQPLRDNQNYWLFVVAVPVIGLVTGLVIHFGWFQRIFFLFQWILHTFSFATILVVGILIPAVAIYLLGGGSGLLDLQKPALSLQLLGRGLQWIFIAIAATLPALLYFLFDRLRVETLRENFFREVLLFDPNLQTTDDAQSLYGRIVDEVYGSGSNNRFLGGARVPIVICTTLFTLGWLLTMLPFGNLRNDLQPTDLLKLFLPQLTPFTIGFLGAYFFGLNMVFRRYVQSDLGPKAYTNVTVRILVTAILVWGVTMLASHGGNLETLIAGTASPTQMTTVTPPIGASGTITTTVTVTTTAVPLAVIPITATATGTPTKGAAAEDAGATSGQPSLGLLILAFLIGIVPETAFQVFRETQQWIGKVFDFSALIEEYPLSDLEGISLYDRARLLEEGIENIENLAHHNIIELMLRTRIPTSRLVDLVDQATLYLHAKKVEEDTKGPDGKPTPSALNRLKRYGIRTATDLEKARDETEASGTKDDFLGLLDTTETKVKRLEIILATLEDDEWMAYIRRWRVTHVDNSERSNKYSEVIKSGPVSS